VDSFARQSGIPIRYVFEGRQGKSFALNSAVPVSRGKILAFTDDDITPRHDWPQTTLGTIRSRELDGVGGKVLPRWEVEPPRWLRERSHLLVWLAMLDNDERRLLDYPITNQCRLVGANMAFHRALFDELGDFNTSLGHLGKRLYGTEETELIHRFLKGGKRVGYDPDIVVYHHVGRARLTKHFFLKRVFYQAVADAVMADAGAPFVGARGAVAISPSCGVLSCPCSSRLSRDEETPSNASWNFPRSSGPSGPGRCACGHRR
jgi:glycosyltransferase involved in cell wall biosynthesis